MNQLIYQLYIQIQTETEVEPVRISFPNFFVKEPELKTKAKMNMQIGVENRSGLIHIYISEFICEHANRS